MSALPEREVYARYVFLDVVNFTSKTAEARKAALDLLNRAVTETVEQKEQVPPDHVIYLPTGDGICIALINIQSIEPQPDGAAAARPPYDIHLRVALNIIKMITEHNGAAVGDGTPSLEVRIGINEDMDYEVKDINQNRNVAGVGINDAQRIMSLAGGNQIFVGERAYKLLSDHDDYRGGGLFHTHRVIVKHDTPMNVYQFIAAGHEGLNTDVQELERRQESVNLIKAATACGLKKIYPYRGAEVEGDILSHIRQARRRVWMLGVGLTEKVQFNKLLREIKPLIDKIDVKILFLNALRSPALFRTFLEIEPTIFSSIIKQNSREYFQQKLYHDFHSTFVSLKDHPQFNHAVRFYGHTPICWMVIVDRTAYFQPYSFGGEPHGENRVIGPWLPVFKFEPPPPQVREAGATDTFKILKQHFTRLWRTSNTDLFHMGLRVENRDKILDKILADRGDWFEYVYDALYDPAHAERRYPRRDCGSKADHLLTWSENGKPKEAKPEIINFSRGGLQLALKDSAPAKGTDVEIRIEKIPDDDQKSSVEYIQRELLAPCDGKFVVRWQKPIKGMLNVGLLRSDLRRDREPRPPVSSS